MSAPHIVVCMKAVPKPEEIRVNPETHLLERSNVRTEINPPDMNAIEVALSLKEQHGGRVSILSMGPSSFLPYLQVGLEMGADHVYLLSDRSLGGADTLATTYTLAQGIRKIGDIDLVLCGEESSDGATGQVPQGLAEWLDMPQITVITDLELDTSKNVARGRRSIRNGYEVLESPLPCVVSVKTACNEPRFMNFPRLSPSSLESKLTTWDATDLDTDAQYTGAAGSPTVVSGLSTARLRDRKKIRLSGSVEEIIRELVKVIRET